MGVQMGTWHRHGAGVGDGHGAGVGDGVGVGVGVGEGRIIRQQHAVRDGRNGKASGVV